MRPSAESFLKEYKEKEMTTSNEMKTPVIINLLDFNLLIRIKKAMINPLIIAALDVVTMMQMMLIRSEAHEM